MVVLPISKKILFTLLLNIFAVLTPLWQTMRTFNFFQTPAAFVCQHQYAL